MSYYDHLGLPEKVLRWLGNPYNAANTAAGFNAGVLAINVLTRRFFGSANGVNIVASAAGIGISILSARQSHYWWKQASADLKRLNESASKDNLWKAEHDRAALDGAAGYHNARLSTLAAGALLTGICSVPKLSVDSKGVVPRVYPRLPSSQSRPEPDCTM